MTSSSSAISFSLAGSASTLGTAAAKGFDSLPGELWRYLARDSPGRTIGAELEKAAGTCAGMADCVAAPGAASTSFASRAAASTSVAAGLPDWGAPLLEYFE